MGSIQGYERLNGKTGIRNVLAILPTCICANDITTSIYQGFSDAGDVILLSHNQGCGQLGQDREQTVRTLSGLAKNPNIGAVLVVGLGCESLQPPELLEQFGEMGKPVEYVMALEEKGGEYARKKGRFLVQRLLNKIRRMDNHKYGINTLCVGLKCGYSDTTSGIASNPVVGLVSDIIVNQGGTVIMAETPESIGAEHALVDRAARPEVSSKILSIINRFEERTKAIGVDIRGANPCPGNIKGGLTTLEEKALGAVKKGGTATIQDVLEYGESPEGKGLFLMDSPGRCPEVLTGLAAAGCQLILFTTGGGAIGASRVCPVVKVCANRRTVETLSEHIDVDISAVIEGTMTLEDASQAVYKELLAICNGKSSKGELAGYGVTSIWSSGSHM